MKNVAIILAAGRGKRAGLEVPKQFADLEKRMVLEWSVLAFAKHESIDEVCVVVPPDRLEFVQNRLQKNNEEAYKKVRHIVQGGTERYLSVLAALRVYEGEECRVLVHDGARPLISERIISECINNPYDACAVGIASTNTIWRVMRGDNEGEERGYKTTLTRSLHTDDGLECKNTICKDSQKEVLKAEEQVTDEPNMEMIPSYAYSSESLGPINKEQDIIADIPNRRELWEAQTPQCFQNVILQSAIEEAIKSGIYDITDDCAVVRWCFPELPIHIIQGEVTNIKITYAEDLEFARLILQKREKQCFT